MPNPLMSQEEVQKRIESELSLPTEDRSKYRRTAVKHMLDKAYNKRKQQQELDKKQQEAEELAARGQSYIGSPSMPQDVKDRVFGTVEENKAQDKINDYNYTASLSWLPTASNPNLSKESRGFMYGVDKDNFGNYVVAGLFPQLNNLSFPYQAAMAVHPAYNLISEDGVKKTVRELSNGNIGAGTLSLAGDLVDASIAAPAAKTAVGGLMFGLGKYGRGSVQNFGRAYTVSNEINSAVNTLPIKTPPLNFGWGPRATVFGTWAHTSPNSILQTSLPEGIVRWDAERGMPLTGGWITEGYPGGMMAERPYIDEYKVSLNKPMVQIGEIPTSTKNATRSQLVRQAESAGADGVRFKDISDNRDIHQNVTYLFDPNTSATFIGRITENGKFVNRPLKLTPGYLYKKGGLIPKCQDNSGNTFCNLFKDKKLDTSWNTFLNKQELEQGTKAAMDIAPKVIKYPDMKFDNNKETEESFYYSGDDKVNKYSP